MAEKQLEPAGFPKCATCALLRGATSGICYGCASQSFTAPVNPCPVCSRAMNDQSACGNPLCNQPSRDIARVSSVAVKTGPIERAILNLKYDNKTGWATIFGRIVLGYLGTHFRPSDWDLIVANPTFLGAGSQTVNHHTELVIDAAAKEDLLGEWAFDTETPRAIVKTGPSPKSATGNYQKKRDAADALADVLAIPERTRTEGRRVLIYDDICTTALQLDRVASVLKNVGGATHVEALVLARQPWRG